MAQLDQLAGIALATLAQTEGPGRGENPSELGGLLIIVGAIVLAIVVIGTAGYLVARATSRRRTSPRREPER